MLEIGAPESAAWVVLTGRPVEGQVTMHRVRHRLLVTLAAVATVISVLAGSLAANAQDETARLIGIRAGQHTGFDRIVFDFAGPLPSSVSARYVTRVTADPSGATVPVRGNAFLELSMQGAHGHDLETGDRSYPDPRPAFALPNVLHVVNSGDFEDVLSFGIGLMQRAPFTVFTLTDPTRVVVDIEVPFRSRTVRVYYQDRFAFEEGREPVNRWVLRTVPSSTDPVAVSRNTMLRLFAHPTAGEKATGLRLVPSGATGFADLTVSSGRVARIRLTGGCTSGGSTYTFADQIMPTLKQFRSVDWVKIYDPRGVTQDPTGQRDSLPTCLEP